MPSGPWSPPVPNKDVSDYEISAEQTDEGNKGLWVPSLARQQE